MIEVIEATTDEIVAKAKELFLEYAESLGFDLSFQSFDKELKDFPSQYSAPTGCLYVAQHKSQIIGCVGLRCFEKGVCEMKRLYVRPDFRGGKAGRMLAEAAIRAAQVIGYERMRLDTLQSMEAANRLYKTLGFAEIEPYRQNPVEGAMFLELDLKRS